MTAPEDYDPHLRKVIRTAIGGRGASLGAELAGMSKRTIQRAMNGQNIQVNTLRRIARAGGYRVCITLEKDTK